MDSRITTIMDTIKTELREPMAIMKKEFMSYFMSPIAYIVIALFLIFCGIFYWIISVKGLKCIFSPRGSYIKVIMYGMVYNGQGLFHHTQITGQGPGCLKK